MDKNDIMWMKIENISKALVYVAKGRDYMWYSHLDRMAENEMIFDTRMGWEFYVVAVGTEAARGSFRIKTWVDQIPNDVPVAIEPVLPTNITEPSLPLPAKNTSIEHIPALPTNGSVSQPAFDNSTYGKIRHPEAELPSYMIYYMVLTWALMIVVGFGCGAMCHFRKQYKVVKKRIAETPTVDAEEKGSPRMSELSGKGKGTAYPSLSDFVPGMPALHDLSQYNTGSKIMSHDHTAQMHANAMSGPFHEASALHASDVGG